MIVDSMPTGVAPPSKISGIRSSNSDCTAEAEVGLIRPNRLALGTANGKPQIRSRLRMVGWLGQRTATSVEPAVTMSGISSVFGSNNVSGPGQKCEIKLGTGG